MKKIILLALICMFCFVSAANALELVRQKNVATYISFPIVDASGDVVTGATGLDSEIVTFSNTAAPGGFTDCTNEAVEVGSAGIYYLSLTQTEMNNDYIYIQIKTTSTGAKTQHILIRTMTSNPSTSLSDIITYTNGVKDGGDYNGIEKMIRANR